MLLEIDGVHAGYGRGEVLHGITLAVPEASLVAVLGPNGAGKSTLLKVAAGLLSPTKGSVRFRGVTVSGHDPTSIARCGVYLLPEGRAVFPSLTVEENLRMATGRAEEAFGDAFDRALSLFPILERRLRQLVGTMSGGEQQMVALARAFVAEPMLLMLDEPSLGLAPLVVDDVFDVIRRFRDAGMTVLLVEQYVHRALDVADLVYIVDRGSIGFIGDPGEIRASDLAGQYLGQGVG